MNRPQVSNGVWTIRIEAIDDDGGMGAHEVNVVVDGQLKLGRFATTWLDFAVMESLATAARRTQPRSPSRTQSPVRARDRIRLSSMPTWV